MIREYGKETQQFLELQGEGGLLRDTPAEIFFVRFAPLLCSSTHLLVKLDVQARRDVVEGAIMLGRYAFSLDALPPPPHPLSLCLLRRRKAEKSGKRQC